MNTTEIKILLDKYYDGETSLDEEKILKSYFASADIDESLLEHAPVFAYFKTESALKAGDDLEYKILQKLNDAAVVPFYKSRIFWTYFTGIAASIIFVFAFIFESQNSHNDQMAGAQQPDRKTLIAYQQTKIALAYVSGTYSRATEPLNEVAKFKNSTITIEEMSKMENELSRINTNVSKMNNGVNNLSKLSKFSIIVKP